MFRSLLLVFLLLTLGECLNCGLGLQVDPVPDLLAQYKQYLGFYKSENVPAAMCGSSSFCVQFSTPKEISPFFSYNFMVDLCNVHLALLQDLQCTGLGIEEVRINVTALLDNLPFNINFSSIPLIGQIPEITAQRECCNSEYCNCDATGTNAVKKCKNEVPTFTLPTAAPNTGDTTDTSGEAPRRLPTTSLLCIVAVLVAALIGT